MRKLLHNGMLLFCLIGYSGLLQAQTPKFNNPGEYMSYINVMYRDMMDDYMSYASAVAHGKTARKIENKRIELINNTNAIIRKVAAMPPYSGDKTLRDSTVRFLRISYNILNEDYGKIVNMEDVAEQSYDAMEAYYLAQDLADKKLKDASKNLGIVNDAFIAKYNIQIIESKDDLGDKLAAAGKVSDYHRKVYLIFFKSYKQEFYMMEAIDKKNVNSIEQNRATLLKFAEEGIAKLDTMKAYNNDKSLVTSCRQMLEFYKKECKDNIGTITNFIIKEENFNKIKKAFEVKKESSRTQADIDQFNAAVNEINKASGEYNTTNSSLFNNRKTLIDNWNKSSQTFLDKHTPKYK